MSRKATIILPLLGLSLAFEWSYQPQVPTEEVVAVLYGYNFFLKDQTTAAGYIAKISPYLKEGKIEAIVLSGGVTRPSEHPGLSEAELMKRELLKHGVTAPIFLEERALNTGQNARFVRELLGSRLPHAKRLMVFSDVVHRWRVRLLSVWYFRGLYVDHFAVGMWAEHQKIRQFNRRSGR